MHYMFKYLGFLLFKTCLYQETYALCEALIRLLKLDSVTKGIKQRNGQMHIDAKTIVVGVQCHF